MKNEYASISATKGYIEWLKNHPSGLTVSGLMKALIVKEILNPTPMFEWNRYDYIQKVVRAENKEELEKWVCAAYEGVRQMGEISTSTKIEEKLTEIPIEEEIEETHLQEPNTSLVAKGKRQRRPVSNNDFNSMI